MAMDSEKLPTPYTAEGPEGLAAVLNFLLEQSQQTGALNHPEQYILYQLGTQKSVIKVDTSASPFQFWYYDLLGRNITLSVKETIAQFLWEKCGEKERFFQEFQGD